MQTFKIFGMLAEAEEIRKLLTENSISSEIEDTSDRMNPALKTTPYSGEFRLNLAKRDFNEALEIIRKHFSDELKSEDEEYYLFSFNDKELHEILVKSEEWSFFDVFLAENILKERGTKINKEIIAEKSAEYNNEISAPENRPWGLIVFGYVFSIGFLGLLFGGLLVNSKKTLPNGTKVYAYSQTDRNHGFAILAIGILWLIYFIIRYILLIEIF